MPVLRQDCASVGPSVPVLQGDPSGSPPWTDHCCQARRKTQRRQGAAWPAVHVAGCGGPVFFGRLQRDESAVSHRSHCYGLSGSAAISERLRPLRFRYSRSRQSLGRISHKLGISGTRRLAISKHFRAARRVPHSSPVLRRVREVCGRSANRIGQHLLTS